MQQCAHNCQSRVSLPFPSPSRGQPRMPTPGCRGLQSQEILPHRCQTRQRRTDPAPRRTASLPSVSAEKKTVIDYIENILRSSNILLQNAPCTERCWINIWYKVANIRWWLVSLVFSLHIYKEGFFDNSWDFFDKTLIDCFIILNQTCNTSLTFPASFYLLSQLVTDTGCGVKWWKDDSATVKTG